MHPVSAEILVERSDRTRNAGETFMHWLFPLHSGTAFGTAGMVAMSLAGIAPLLLVLTGLWVWLRKRPGERLAAEHQRARSAARAGTKSGV
ncbi:MAG: PepSY domain-containing protein [Betaproteobacteria bacterium]